MDERFLHAWFLRQHTVLERKLRPFSLAHRVVLEAVGSPFASEDTPFAMSDLAVAVQICSASNPFLPLRRPRWLERVRFWRGTLDPSYFRQESQKFVHYLDEHSSGPKFWQPVEPLPFKEKIPWPLDVAAGLLRRTNLSEEQVWFMPVGKAFWYYTALCKQDGANPDVLTTQDEALLDSLRKEAVP